MTRRLPTSTIEVGLGRGLETLIVVGPILMLLVWITMGVALIVHEGSHYLLLRIAGLHPRPSFHFPGIGWRFNTAGASNRQLVDIWLGGPLMEALVWGTSALLFPQWAWELFVVMGVEMATNLLLPGSDGRRALRLVRSERAQRGMIIPSGSVAPEASSSAGPELHHRESSRR
ncbi:MAG: hypothetical protein ACYDC5_12385 [Candidatus Dormibacteria bacterium]